MVSFPIPSFIEKTNGVNFHFQPGEYVWYTFVFSPFPLSCNIAVDFYFHTSWRLGQKPQNIQFGISSKILPHLCPTELHATQSLICCQTSCQSWFEEWAQFVCRYILDQSDLLFCCVSDYVLMKQSHSSCMITCAEDCISLSNYIYLVNEIPVIQSVFSRDPEIIVSINCIILLLVIEFIATRCNLFLINLV